MALLHIRMKSVCKRRQWRGEGSGGGGGGRDGERDTDRQRKVGRGIGRSKNREEREEGWVGEGRDSRGGIGHGGITHYS